MSESSHSIWKPLFWLVLATLIAVYVLYNDHRGELQAQIGEENPSLRSLSRNLEAVKDELAQTTQALNAAESEISTLQSTHAEQLDSLKAEHRALTNGMQQAHDQRLAELMQLLAATTAGSSNQSSMSDASSGDDSDSSQAEPGAEQEDAGQSAREQGRRLHEDLIEQVSEQIHDFYARFAPLEAQLTERGLLVNLSDENIRFPSGSVLLPEQAGPGLSQVAKILVDYPDLSVQIEGHTDSTGSAAINLQLSEQRAGAVRDALIERGVKSERLSIKGVGSKQPIADNATEAGRQRNRRVELYVVREDND